MGPLSVGAGRGVACGGAGSGRAATAGPEITGPLKFG